jgi:hypothetical protein
MKVMLLISISFNLPFQVPTINHSQKSISKLYINIIINREWNDFSESLRISFEKLILIEHYEKSRIEINITIL